MTNGFLPGWEPREGGAASAALAVLDRFAGLVEERRQQVPDKLFLAFLDALGVTLMAPSPARVPLVFRLAEGAPTDVLLAENSAVAAERPPPLPDSLAARSAEGASEPIVFATERAVSLARARLASVQSVVPAQDRYADHTAALEAGFTLFDALQQVPHHLYLGHDRLFDINGGAEISLQVGVARAAGEAGVALMWEYRADAGWLAFDPVIDQTKGLTVDGVVLLRKSAGPPLVATEIDGARSFWIRGRVVEPLPLPDDVGGSWLPRIDTLRVRVRVGERGLPLDAAFCDGLGLDASKDFLPFGRLPAPGTALVVACDEAFRREGATVAISVRPSADNGVQGDPKRRLAWDVSTGEGTWRTIRADGSEQFDATAVRDFAFPRPEEWREATVSGERHFWLRVRVTDTSYGELKVDATGARYPKVPSLARMTASFSYATAPERLHHCRSLNRFQFADHTEAAGFGRNGFEPFKPLPDRRPAVHLGFDQPLPVGLVSLFADVAVTTEAGAAPQTSPFEWEYRSQEGWSELPVSDGTSALRARGVVQFIGPPDMVADSGPGGPLYWVRARLKTATATPEMIRLASLHLNAVWASHRAVVRDEIVGAADGTARQVIALRNSSVLDGEVVELQEWHGTTRDWESLFRGVAPDRLAFDRDGRGQVTGVWVRWEGRKHLHASGPNDRHYALERTAGRLRFGDGEFGMLPPAGAVIRAAYEYGGGPGGNVAAGTAGQLLSAVPFVQSVTNPVAAAGGAAAETVRGVRARGPQQLRHRGRAVAASDVEWLARSASTEVALARCLPATGPEGLPSPGWIGIVIAPWGDGPEPLPSAELLQRVRAYVAARVPAAVASRVRVLGPRYRAASLAAEVVVAAAAAAAAVEDALRDALDRFLHPLHGGAGGAGWAFGEPVALSQLAGVVRAVAGVSYVRGLQLTTGGAVAGERVDVDPDELPSSGRHLLKLRLEA